MISRGSPQVEIEDETEVGGQTFPLEIKANAARSVPGGGAARPSLRPGGYASKSQSVIEITAV
jgi:hypothetical protein